MRSALVVLSFVAGSLAGPSAARAQETGGSFGGGDWGDDSAGSGGSDWGGGGGGGSDWGSGSGGGGGGIDWGSNSDRGSSWGGSDSDWGSSTSGSSTSSGRRSYRSTGGGCGRPTLPSWGCPGLVLLLFLWVVLVVAKHSGRPRDRAPAGPTPVRTVAGVDVSAISLAIDWRERKRLQGRLEQLAKSGKTGTSGGRAALLHETVIELRRVQHAWLYAGAVNAAPSPKQEARATFTRVAQDMRARFRRELVRSAGGELVTDDAPELRKSALEGPGVVVVTVVVAARGNIPDVANARDGEHLRMLMRALGALDAAMLVALAVIWSPAAEDDRMSTVELEALYPELQKIDPASLGGRTFCAYCGFPHPAELLRCPECGAPTAAVT